MSLTPRAEAILWVIAELRSALHAWQIESREWSDTMGIAEESGLVERQDYEAFIWFHQAELVQTKVIGRLADHVNAVRIREERDGTPAVWADETGPELLRRLLGWEWASVIQHAEAQDGVPPETVTALTCEVLQKLQRRCDAAGQEPDHGERSCPVADHRAPRCL